MAAVAYHNGRFVPADAVSLSHLDAGFVSGATVVESDGTFDAPIATSCARTKVME